MSFLYVAPTSPGHEVLDTLVGESPTVFLDLRPSQQQKEEDQRLPATISPSAQRLLALRGGTQEGYVYEGCSYSTVTVVFMTNWTSYHSKKLTAMFWIVFFIRQLSLFLIKLLHIIIRLTHANVWESMGKPCSCMQFIKSHIFTASHARIRISTSSHVRIHIKYCKSCALHLNVQ